MPCAMERRMSFISWKSPPRFQEESGGVVQWGSSLPFHGSIPAGSALRLAAAWASISAVLGSLRISVKSRTSLWLAMTDCEKDWKSASAADEVSLFVVMWIGLGGSYGMAASWSGARACAGLWFGVREAAVGVRDAVTLGQGMEIP